MITHALFWSSGFYIFYAYAGYPLLLKILSCFFGSPVRKEHFTPSVSLIISAYNEENVIADKLDNSLALDYPSKHLEIIVLSDGSSDRTEEIAGNYSPSGVKTLRVEGRLGKTSCLNRAVPVAKGEIIIFSDANSVYEKNAIREIVANFADNTVGCVTGYTRYISSADNNIDESVSHYTQVERITKSLESKIGSCVGADGAIFAIRKELYQPLKATDINDFVIPLMVVRKGYRTVLEENAWCSEETAKDFKGEFSRQVRITNRTLRAIFNNKDLLNIFVYKLFSYELFSHKLAKFLVPLFLTVVFLANLILAKGKWLYKCFIAMQAIFYIIAAFRGGSTPGPFESLRSACRTFVIVNAAILKGWITYIRGEDFTTWKSSRSKYESVNEI